jgi:hypothetical protein
MLLRFLARSRLDGGGERNINVIETSSAYHMVRKAFA